LVEAWSESRLLDEGHAPALKLDEVDAALGASASEAESEAAHRAAGWYVARLLRHSGRVQVLDWLRSGVPAEVVAAVGQR
jgi:hypothetical protein